MALPRERLDQLWRRGRDFLGTDVAIMGGAMSWISERHLVAAAAVEGRARQLVRPTRPLHAAQRSTNDADQAALVEFYQQAWRLFDALPIVTHGMSVATATSYQMWVSV